MKFIFKSQIFVIAIILAWSLNVYAQYDHNIGYNPHPPTKTIGQMPIQDNINTVTTITQSTSMNVVAGSSVACGYGSGITTPNSFYRSFVLSNFGITTSWTVTKVSIGVETASGPDQPITCKLYTTSQPFPNGFPGSLTLIGSKTLNVAAQSLTLLDFPVIATAPIGSELVVEISSTDGFATSGGFYIGANGLGESAPSYLMSDSCGISTPITTAAIGFPSSMWVMSVTGTTDLFFDNFDSYIAGQRLACQNPINWTTWSNLPCNTTEDPVVSSTYSFSPSNSVKIALNNDCVKLLGNKTTGKWYVSFMVYIPAGKVGYFNTLAVPPAAADWAMEVYFNAGGAGQLTTVPGGPINFNWQAGVWNQVMVAVDFEQSPTLGEFWFGQVGQLAQLYTWDWTQAGTITDQLGGNDFFGATASDEMYIDDYYFSDAPPPIQQLANDVGTFTIDMATQYGPGSITPKVTVKNYGSAANTFNVQMTITGGYTSTKSVTNLAAGATQQVTFDNWNPSVMGPYTVNVCTQLGTDQNTANDCQSQGVYIWDASGDWTSGAVYPITTYNGIGVPYNDGATNYLFVMGGNTASTLGTECYKYNVTTNSWTLLAPLPAKRIILCGAAVGNFIYAIGGSDGAAYYNTVYKYDIAGNTWSTVASLPITIGWGRAVSYNNNYIYVAGGVDAFTGGNYLNTVYLYNVTTNIWTTATSMPVGVFGGGFALTGNKLVYAAGAFETGISNTVFVGTIDAGNPALITWQTMDNPYPGINEQFCSRIGASLTQEKLSLSINGNNHSPDAIPFPAGAMYRIHAGPWGSDAIIVAGGSPTSTYSAADPSPCYIYKPATDTWIAQENVPVPVCAYQSGSVDDGSTWKLIMASGFGVSAVTNVTQIYTQTISLNTFPLSVDVANGWNMTSVPGTNPDGMLVGNWWVNHVGTVYKFVPGSGYSGITTTAPGEGYWMKNSITQTYNTGDEWPAGGIQLVTHNPINAAAKWNMFGGYEDMVDPAALTTTPPSQIIYPIYKFVPGSGYQTATQIVPGYGYWIKVNAACQIIVPNVLVKSNQVMAEIFKDDWGKITITDAAGSSYTLYAVKGQVDLDKYELPPLPPAGLFDVRFGSGRVAEDINSSAQSIEMSGMQYPIKVRVEKMDISLQDVTGKQLNVNIKSGEEITISNANINKLMVSGNLIPDKFALEQNYPNPFNPSTTIEFSIPEAANVSLTIYNMLGQKVAELVNGKLEAGRYNYQWNAKNVATGMYIYELRTEKFVSIKKMLLLK